MTEIPGRPLGLMETALWLVDQAVTLNVCAMAEIRGPLSLEVTRRALAEAQRRHPLLRVRLVVEKKLLRFEGWPGDRPPPIPLDEVQLPFARWPEAVEQQIHTRLDTERKPLLRSVLLRHGPDHHTLLMCFHHVIGDGISGAYLARDVLQSAGDLAAGGLGTLEPLPMPETLESHFPDKVRGFRGFRVILREVRWFRKECRRLGGHSGPLRSDSDAHYSKASARLMALRYEPEITRQLVAAARNHQTSVHGLLGAAVCRAVYPELEEKRDPAVMALGSPVNLRHRMSPPVGHDVGLFASMVSTLHRVGVQTPLWDIARELRQGLLDVVNRDAPLYMLRGLGFLSGRRRIFPLNAKGVDRNARFYLKHLSSEATAGLTNIGRLDLESQVGPLRLEAVHFAVSPSILSNLVVTAATLNDTLCVNFVHNEPFLQYARAQSIADRFDAHMRGALSG